MFINFFIETAFWISLLLILYSYFGYGAFIYLYLKLISNNKKIGIGFTPSVTLVIAAYNEEDFIRNKINNSLSLIYPKEKLSFIFITDGSTDNTTSIIKEYPELVLLHTPERKGKTAALNRAMKFVKTPIVIFTDANTLLNNNCIINIVRHYSDEAVGGVAGEKKIINNVKEATASETGEGLYWKYESFLKKLDSEFYSVVGAAGELFSIRTELFDELEDDVLLDDFIISLRVCQKGYKVKYEPDAYAIESASASMKEEQKRKIRISAGGFQSIIMLKGLLNPFNNPKLFFLYLSHRVLRWAVCPFLLPIIFIANAGLAFTAPTIFYQILFGLQVVFYLLAIIGWYFANRNIKIKQLYVPYYFVFMNASLYIGLYKFLKGNQSVLWDKAARKKVA